MRDTRTRRSRLSFRVVAAFAAAAIFGPDAHAEEVHRCENEAGEVEFRDQPCTADTDLVAIVASPAVREPSGVSPGAGRSDTDVTAIPGTDDASAGLPASDVPSSDVPSSDVVAVDASVPAVPGGELLVGRWSDAAGIDVYTVSPGGSLLFETPEGERRGQWRAVGADRYRLSVGAADALECDATLDGATLTVSCGGAMNGYRRL